MPPSPCLARLELHLEAAEDARLLANVGCRAEVEDFESCAVAARQGDAADAEAVGFGQEIGSRSDVRVIVAGAAGAVHHEMDAPLKRYRPGPRMIARPRPVEADIVVVPGNHADGEWRTMLVEEL